MKFVTACGSTIPRARGQGMGAYRLGALHALRAPLLAVSARHTRRYMTRRMPGTAALATAASSAAGQSEVPKSGDVLTLECTSLAFGGRGVCKLPGGFVVFCDRAVPGETLEARVTSLKGGGRFAEATKVSSISPCEHRTAAPCPHFERCGGCTWQDIAYAHQLTMKRDQVVDVMTRVAKVDQTRVQTIVGDCVPSDKTERYRNKMEFAFGPGANGRGVVIGLRPSGNHSDLVEIGNPDGCLLQHPVADEVLRGCRAHLDSDGNSLLDAFNRRTGEGVLRSLTVRVAVDENGEAIAAVGIAAAAGCGDGGAAAKEKPVGPRGPLRDVPREHGRSFPAGDQGHESLRAFVRGLFRVGHTRRVTAGYENARTTNDRLLFLFLFRGARGVWILSFRLCSIWIFWVYGRFVLRR